MPDLTIEAKLKVERHVRILDLLNAILNAQENGELDKGSLNGLLWDLRFLAEKSQIDWHEIPAVKRP